MTFLTVGVRKQSHSAANLTYRWNVNYQKKSRAQRCCALMCCSITDSSPEPRCRQAAVATIQHQNLYPTTLTMPLFVAGSPTSSRPSTICTAAEDPLTRLEHSQYVVKLNAPQRVSSRLALGASRSKCTRFPPQRGYIQPFGSFLALSMQS